MKKLNWLIVAIFLVLAALIVVPFFFQSNQKMDAHELKLQTQSLEAATTEGRFLADHKDKQTSQYFSSQLEDLAKTTRDIGDEVEKKPYESSLSEKRTQFITLSKQAENTLRKLSESFADESALVHEKEAVFKLSKSFEKLANLYEYT